MDQTAAAAPLTEKRFPREQEGFARAIGSTGDQLPQCSSVCFANPATLRDFRGPVPGPAGNHRDQTAMEWETSPAAASETTVFTWIGGTLRRPAGPAFPHVTATLTVDGRWPIRMPVGRPFPYQVASAENPDCILWFQPKRFQSLVEAPHRCFEPDGVSGFYRLQVPGAGLAAGRAVRVRVELDPPAAVGESYCYVSPRTDVLPLTLGILRDQVAQLQDDLTQVRLSHEMLYAQVYPELFPDRIRGARAVICQHPTKHYHPASITVMADDEVVVTAREALDHLARDGRMILVRSRDGGRTWGPVELMFDLGGADHRSSPIVELPNGDWVTTDYRAGAEYTDGLFAEPKIKQPTLWGAWSTDRGRSWKFSANPLTVPGAASPYAEAERHLIRLPSGRLLVAANYHARLPTPAQRNYVLAVFASDDNGRRWELLARLPDNPHIIGEPTLLRTRRGEIVLLARTHLIDGPRWTESGGVFQSVSGDDGRIWSAYRDTGMSSMGSPAHLLQLQDGRVLCTHASRHYPGSIYVTVSRDDCQSWETDRTRIVANDLQNDDSCYPTSGQLADGTLITVWYANLFGKFYLAALRYRPEDL
ncbi:exo-alpha-sialidase [bacterium]|nr:exo-alpha-sialidase [bacterium]